MSDNSSITRRAALGGAAVAGAAALGGGEAMAQAAARKTYVLIHGAWHGGWCWRRVADRLTAKGHKVFTPTLTGLGERSHLLAKGIDVSTHVTDVVNVVKWEGLKDICLVGHSYGGMPISVAAEALEGRIASFVFLDAFVPENGETPLDLVPPARADEIRAAIARGGVSRDRKSTRLNSSHRT